MHVHVAKMHLSGDECSRPSTPIHKRPRSMSPNHRHSTRPSPAPWADTPFQLIPTPRTSRTESGAVFVASEMAHIHNTLLRGLNSIIQQAPYVADARSQDYVAQDVRDLMLYISAWCEALEHHHHVEETTFFPMVEKMMDVQDLMDEMEEQHEEFQLGLFYFKEYASTVGERPYLYRWPTMNAMIAKFAPALVHHLYDEIDFLLSMDKFDSEGLKKCWLETQKVAIRFEDDDMKYKILPFILGNSDRTFEEVSDFPYLSKSTRYAVKLWFASKHRGAWRFNSCDFAGRPVALQMLPENRMEE